MSMKTDKLIEQLTRIADALETQNDLSVALEERLREEQEAEQRRLREDEERMQGLPEVGGDRLLH